MVLSIGPTCIVQNVENRQPHPSLRYAEVRIHVKVLHENENAHPIRSSDLSKSLCRYAFSSLLPFSGNSQLQASACNSMKPLGNLFSSGSCLGWKNATDLVICFDEGKFKEVVLVILDEFRDSQDQAPRLWPMTNGTFEDYPDDLLTYIHVLWVIHVTTKDFKQSLDKVVRV